MQPAIEYMSAAHPEWWDQETDYVLSQARRGFELPEPRSDDAHPDAINEEECLARLRNPATRDGAICDLLEEVGPDVLWPHAIVAGFASNRSLGLRDSIRALVQERTTTAWVASRFGALAERQDAHRFLLAVGQALAGDQRGMRERVVFHPLNVRKRYFSYLFRATKALDLVRVWPWARMFAEKIRDAAKACGFPEEELRTLLLTSEGQRRPGVRLDGCGELTPPWLQEHARTWAARPFGITEGTVAKLCTPSGVRGRGSGAARARRSRERRGEGTAPRLRRRRRTTAPVR